MSAVYPQKVIGYHSKVPLVTAKRM